MGATPPPPIFHNVQSLTTLEVEQAVEAEMRCHAYGNTNKLIPTLFGSKHLEGIIDRVLNGLIKRGVYVLGSDGVEGHWVTLPIRPAVEDVLYEPLTTILNEITKEIGNDASFNIEWKDVHSTAPRSDFMAELRPDILATFKDLLQEVDYPRVWWRIIHTLIEVKKKAEPLPAAMQLLRYLRQTLREQPDRRFIYGMVFSKVNLTLWHADRTGALASQLINVHKDPRSFVQVIVGLIVSTPAELGWDPTMKRYIMDQNTGNYEKFYSYEVDAKTAMAPDDPYGTIWVVTMPKLPPPPADSPTHLRDDCSRDTDSQTLSSSEGNSPTGPKLDEYQEVDEEEFVLFHALSLARAEVIRGRATRIWKAWRMVDMELPKNKRPVFVFKDAWRDERRGLEGALYLHAGTNGDGVARVHSYGEVRINGEVDDTLKMIRKHVATEGEPLNLKTTQSKTKTVDPMHVDTYRLESSGHFDEWTQDWFDGEVDSDLERVPRNRIHSRLVMASFGYPLIKFANLPELLKCLSDAIRGHEWLYEQGILHRDISVGNILITGLEHPNRGILIDLDYAIKHLTHESLWDDERSGTLAFMSYEVLRHQVYPLKSGADLSQTICLGPDSDEEHDDEEADALPPPTKPIIPVHGAVHDLESFFWVLCWICIARDGPAKPRVFDKVPVSLKHPRNYLRRIFEQRDADKIAMEKEEIIISEENFKSRILKSFAPYFEPLVKLVEALYRHLRVVYTKRKFDGLHGTFVNLLDQVEKKAKVQGWHEKHEERGYKGMEALEVTRRDMDNALWDSPKRKRTQHTRPLKRTRAGDFPAIAEVEEPEEVEDEMERDRESSPSEARRVRRRLEKAI